MSMFEQELTNIASRRMNIKTLETRGRDGLDFHDVSVYCLRLALIDAYNMGVKAASEAALQTTEEPQ